MSKFEPGTVEKDSLTIGPPAGTEPTPVRKFDSCQRTYRAY